MYFDPFSPEDISSKLKCLLQLDSPSRASFAEGGLHHVASYSWEKAAVDTWRVLQFAANG
jgi:hypothetical protein